MKKALVFVSVLSVFAGIFTLGQPCGAWEDDYVVSPRDAWEADSYNEGAAPFCRTMTMMALRIGVIHMITIG